MIISKATNKFMTPQQSILILLRNRHVLNNTHYSLIILDLENFMQLNYELCRVKSRLFSYRQSINYQDLYCTYLLLSRISRIYGDMYKIRIFVCSVRVVKYNKIVGTIMNVKTCYLWCLYLLTTYIYGYISMYIWSKIYSIWNR